MIRPTCPECQTIHESSAVIAVGKFDPDGIRGYRPRLGGVLRSTRDEAMRDVCASRIRARPMRPTTTTPTSAYRRAREESA